MADNFLVISLCDNDFGAGLELATRQILDKGLDQQPEKADVIKKIVIAGLLHQAMETNALTDNPVQDRLIALEKFFTDRVRVSFERKAPDLDHDGGSRYIDLHSQQVHSF